MRTTQLSIDYFVLSARPRQWLYIGLSFPVRFISQSSSAASLLYFLLEHILLDLRRHLLGRAAVDHEALALKSRDRAASVRKCQRYARSVRDLDGRVLLVELGPDAPDGAREPADGSRAQRHLLVGARLPLRRLARAAAALALLGHWRGTPTCSAIFRQQLIRTP